VGVGVGEGEGEGGMRRELISSPTVHDLVSHGVCLPLPDEPMTSHHCRHYSVYDHGADDMMTRRSGLTGLDCILFYIPFLFNSFLCIVLYCVAFSSLPSSTPASFHCPPSQDQHTLYAYARAPCTCTIHALHLHMHMHMHMRVAVHRYFTSYSTHPVPA
jgi:hypothetical protein